MLSGRRQQTPTFQTAVGAEVDVLSQLLNYYMIRVSVRSKYKEKKVKLNGWFRHCYRLKICSQKFLLFFFFVIFYFFFIYLFIFYFFFFWGGGGVQQRVREWVGNIRLTLEVKFTCSPSSGVMNVHTDSMPQVE